MKNGLEKGMNRGTETRWEAVVVIQGRGVGGRGNRRKWLESGKGQHQQEVMTDP